MVAFFAFFLVHVGSGPLWLSRVSIEQQRCLHNWWTNLLYVNNYVNTDALVSEIKENLRVTTTLLYSFLHQTIDSSDFSNWLSHCFQCMFQSWHLSCDFHFLLMAPIFVYFLWKRPKTAIAIMLVLIAICSALLFALTFIYNLDANLLAYKSWVLLILAAILTKSLDFRVLSDLSADPTFRITYIPTHTRFGPYLFGILASYAYYKRKSYGVIPEALTYCGAVIVGILLNIPVASALAFYADGVDYNVWTAALYASLHRIPWSIGLCMIIVVTATNNAYYFQNILSWPALAPLSRLTYCVFLVHSSIQLFTAASIRVPPYNSHFNFVSISNLQVSGNTGYFF